MGWETRQRGGRYYTRSRKVGGRVVRAYIGSGPLAELIAAQDAAAREELVAEAAALWAARERLAPAEAALAAFDRTVEALAGNVLAAAGYHRHHRGEWRKRRGGIQGNGQAGAAGAAGDRAGAGHQGHDGTGRVARGDE